MTEVLSIDPERFKSNADLIVAAAEMGYLDGDVLDLTVGPKAGFWKKHRPAGLVTNDVDPDVPADFHYDFRSLPEGWGGFWNTTVLDPPYKLDGTPQDRGPGMANTRFGVGEDMREYESHDAIDQMYLDGLAEAVRVTRVKGYVLVKLMDQVAGMRTRWESWSVANFMRDQRCRYVTSFFLLGSRKQPDGRTQRNPRNNYSQLMVFRVGET